MSPDNRPGQRKHTQATIDYFEHTVYPDWPKPKRIAPLGNVVPEAKRKKFKPHRKEIPTTSILSCCGGKLTIFGDGKSFEHHLRGCTHEEN